MNSDPVRESTEVDFEEVVWPMIKSSEVYREASLHLVRSKGLVRLRPPDAPLPLVRVEVNGEREQALLYLQRREKEFVYILESSRNFRELLTALASFKKNKYRSPIRLTPVTLES
jgi:hypothetical protein